MARSSDRAVRSVSSAARMSRDSLGRLAIMAGNSLAALRESFAKDLIVFFADLERAAGFPSLRVLLARI